MTVGSGGINAGDLNVYVPTVTTGSITDVSTAAPPVVTSTGHALSTGDKVRITSTGGTTEINDRVYTITWASSSTFSLDGATTTNTYTSGGTWTKVTNYARCLASVGQSRMAVYTIPANYPNAYLISWYVDLTSVITSAADVTMWTRDYGESWRVRWVTGVAATSPWIYQLAAPFRFAPKSDVRLRLDSVSVSNTHVSAGFELILGSL